MSDEEPNSTLWTAGGFADEFRSHQLRRAERRHIRNACLMILATILIVGIPGWKMYLNYQDARRQMLIEEFVSLRPSLETLHNPGNPAIESRIQQADKLRTEAGKQSGSEAVASLRTAIGKVKEATEIDRDVERIRTLHKPVGITLIETPWQNTSKVIEAKVQELNHRRVQITGLMDAGNVREAEENLASLLSDVGILQRDNVEALITSQTRQTWSRLNSSVPDRLRENSELVVVRGIGTHAEQGWDSGDWLNARALYGQAAENLQKFLDTQLNPEEKGKLLVSSADAVARLETEKADLAKQIDSLHQDKQSLSEQLAATNSQRLNAEKAVTTLTEERDGLQQTAAAGTTELGQLRPLKQQLADTNKKLTKAQKDFAALNTAKSQADQDLQRLTAELSAKTTEVAALLAAAGDGNDNSVIVQVSATLAAIESKLAGGTLKSSADAASTARTLLADALQQYDQAVAERTKAIAEKWKPDSSKVQAIEKTILQAEGTLRVALKALDEPLAGQFASLQTLIASAEVDEQRILKDVFPEHPEAVKLKQKIDSLKSQQTTLKPAHDRFHGEAKLTGATLVSLSRQHVSELMRQRQVAEFQKLKADGKIPTAANMTMVAISPGTFTMGEGSDAHAVTISKPFFAGKHEVTIAQTLVWLNSPGVVFKDEWIDLSDTDCPVRKNGNRFERNTSTKFASSDEQPMQNISHFGAIAFCEWCSKQDSRFKYRLPTEAEWEYIARAGSTSSYPWGDSCNGTEANVDGTNPHGTTTGGPYKQVTTTVGSYSPNAWGLHETVGNTWEWCSDWYDAGYYAASPGTDPTGPSSGSSRVLRGGSWGNDAIFARSSGRYGYTPGFRGYYIGFRVVAE